MISKAALVAARKKRAPGRAYPGVHIFGEVVQMPRVHQLLGLLGTKLGQRWKLGRIWAWAEWYYEDLPRAIRQIASLQEDAF